MLIGGPSFQREPRGTETKRKLLSGLNGKGVKRIRKGNDEVARMKLSIERYLVRSLLCFTRCYMNEDTLIHD